MFIDPESLAPSEQALLPAVGGESYTQKEFQSPAAVTERWDATPGVFISYRREDAPAHAGRLYDQLAERFGDDHVFMDVDTIEPGADFVERIEEAVGAAAVLLVVMGRGWLDAKDELGRRRLDDPDDFVRLEVASALARQDVRVIPVLVGGATMPEKDELPAALAVLSRKNALVVSDIDWRSGIARLFEVLDPPVEPAVPPRRSVEPRPRSSAGAAVLGIAGAAALVLGTLLQLDWFAHPDFGPADRDGLGYFTSLAPMGLAVGAVGALLLSLSRGGGAIANGLLLGFALGGVVRYVGILGGSGSTLADEGSRIVGGVVLALVGCLLLAAAAFWRAAADPEAVGAGEEVGSLPRVLAILGAVLVVAGTVVPFNDGPGIAEGTLVDRDGGWAAFDPFATAIFAVVASFALATATRRMLACGVLIGLGILATLLWVRYLAIPALQPDTISSPGPGAFLGLAGACAILLGGVVARGRLTRAAVPGGVPAGRAA